MKVYAIFESNQLYGLEFRNMCSIYVDKAAAAEKLLELYREGNEPENCLHYYFIETWDVIE